VRSFVVSRDGTRLVAVVRRAAGDELVVSRIAHNRRGRVLWATPARSISEAPDGDLPVRAIAWRGTTSLAILSPFTGTGSPAQLQGASIDGSPASDSSTTVGGGPRALLGSPASDEPLFGFNRRVLINLSANPRRLVPVTEGTTGFTYVG